MKAGRFTLTLIAGLYVNNLGRSLFSVAVVSCFSWWGISLCGNRCFAQDNVQPLPAPLVPSIVNQIPDEPTFQIRGIGDLSSLLEYYRGRRNIQVLISPDSLQQSLSGIQLDIDTDYSFPESALDDLVVQLLRLNGLGLVPFADKPGWYRVVPLAEVRPFADLLLNPEDTTNGPYATKVFRLQNLTTEQFRTQLAPFIPRLIIGQTNSPRNGNDGGDRSNIQYLDNWNIVLMTDLVANLQRVDRLLERLDVPPEAIVTQTLEIENLPAAELKEQLESVMLELGQEAAGPPNANGSPSITPKERDLRLAVDQRGNRLIIVGTQAKIADVLKLVETLDVQTGTTEIYNLQYISGDEFASVLHQRFGGDEEKSSTTLQLEVRNDNRSVVITGATNVHKAAMELQKLFDQKPVIDTENPRIKIYKIKYVQAAELLETIQSVQQRQTNRGRQPSRGLTTRGISSLPITDDVGPRGLGGASQQIGNVNSINAGGNNSLGGSGQPSLFADNGLTDGPFVPAGFRPESYRERGTGSVLDQAFVTIDVNSNSLIVDADPTIHALYADLIKRLDKRRPQVLIEVSVVAISDSDDLNIGIEMSGGDRTGDNRSFVFTQYGLSTADAASGALTLAPGVGFNGAILKPDVADVVLRALANHSRAKVISAPRILVNDNATGTLSSVAEVPFAGLNSSQNFASTTLQGFAEAGTTITMTPQISEADHLNLEFDILVNDFTGEGTDVLPPPRQSNQATSEVAIPDGHTVIVGGLTRERWSRADSGIPFLEKIPVARLFGGSLAQSRGEDRLFIFIRPIILRDERFGDLLNVSETPLYEAEINDGFPESCPIYMK